MKHRFVWGILNVYSVLEFIFFSSYCWLIKLHLKDTFSLCVHIVLWVNQKENSVYKNVNENTVKRGLMVASRGHCLTAKARSSSIYYTRQTFK